MTDAALVAVASASFVVSHFLLSHPLRAPVVRRIGEGPFLGLYSLVAAITLGWTAWTVRAVPESEPMLWIAPDWLWTVGAVLMLGASIMLAGSLVRNPAAPSLDRAPELPTQPTGVYAVTRHPMMWSFTIWSLVHALVWPTPVSLILSAAIAILALGGAAAQDAKKRRLFPDRWPGWMRRTSFLPFASMPRTRDLWPGFGVLAGGIAIWLAATWAHPPLGSPMVGLWRWLAG